MVNTEEKSRTLNFQRFHFSSIQQSLFEMKDPTVMKWPNSPIALQYDTQNVYCNVAAWGKLGKIIFCRGFLCL